MKNIPNDNINTFFNNNLLVDSRTIYIGMPDAASAESGDHNVSFYTASEVIKSVHLLESVSYDDITVYLMTYGGSVDAGLAIYDILTQSKCEIVVKGIGAVMSMGAIILQAASPGQRFLYPYTTVMLHCGEDGFSHGPPQNYYRWADYSKKQATRTYNLFAKHCGRDKSTSKADYWRKKLVHDWILTAEEAVEHNIADYVFDRSQPLSML